MTPEQLKYFRARLKLTQRGLAERFGMSTKSVSNWEQGLKPVPPWVPNFIELLLREEGR